MANSTTKKNQSKNGSDVQDSPPPYWHTIANVSYSCYLWLTKNVIFTVKTMMWMFTHEPAPPWTLQVWEHLLTLLTSYSMFELLKGSMSFGGSVFWRMDIWNFWSWLLFVLVVAGVRYICDGMPIRWWTILYITTIFALVLLKLEQTHWQHH
jgi:hypothetical protein